MMNGVDAQAYSVVEQGVCEGIEPLLKFNPRAFYIFRPPMGRLNLQVPVSGH